MPDVHYPFAKGHLKVESSFVTMSFYKCATIPRTKTYTFARMFFVAPLGGVTLHGGVISENLRICGVFERTTC
eukprot:1460195-Amphidinium_carterae.1